MCSSLRHSLRHPLRISLRLSLPLAALCLIAAAPAVALDLPTRKAGLWEVKMLFESRNLPPQAIQQCIDAATDKVMNSFSGSLRQDKCSKQDVQKVGNTMVVDSVCEIAGATTTSHAVITGDFNSGYTVKVTSKRSGGPAIPGMPANGTTTLSIEAKHLGACKPDQKPGDMIMAGGHKINILDMQKMMPGAAGKR